MCVFIRVKQFTDFISVLLWYLTLLFVWGFLQLSFSITVIRVFYLNLSYLPLVIDRPPSFLQPVLDQVLMRGGYLTGWVSALFDSDEDAHCVKTLVFYQKFVVWILRDPLWVWVPDWVPWVFPVAKINPSFFTITQDIWSFRDTFCHDYMLNCPEKVTHPNLKS